MRSTQRARGRGGRPSTYGTGDYAGVPVDDPAWVAAVLAAEHTLRERPGGQWSSRLRFLHDIAEEMGEPGAAEFVTQVYYAAVRAGKTTWPPQVQRNLRGVPRPRPPLLPAAPRTPAPRPPHHRAAPPPPQPVDPVGWVDLFDPGSVLDRWRGYKEAAAAGLPDALKSCAVALWAYAPSPRTASPYVPGGTPCLLPENELVLAVVRPQADGRAPVSVLRPRTLDAKFEPYGSYELSAEPTPAATYGPRRPLDPLGEAGLAATAIFAGRLFYEVAAWLRAAERMALRLAVLDQPAAAMDERQYMSVELTDTTRTLVTDLAAADLATIDPSGLTADVAISRVVVEQPQVDLAALDVTGVRYRWAPEAPWGGTHVPHTVAGRTEARPAPGLLGWWLTRHEKPGVFVIDVPGIGSAEIA